MRRSWHYLRAAIIALVITLSFFASLYLAVTVDNNSNGVDYARDAVLASCQNLNRKIDASTNEAAQRSTNFLIREIAEHMTAAERKRYAELVEKAAQTPLRKTRCDRIVARTFPE
jgi:hypothetical protein